MNVETCDRNNNYCLVLCLVALAVGLTVVFLVIIVVVVVVIVVLRRRRSNLSRFHKALLYTVSFTYYYFIKCYIYCYLRCMSSIILCRNLIYNYFRAACRVIHHNHQILILIRFYSPSYVFIRTTVLRYRVHCDILNCNC